MVQTSSATRAPSVAYSAEQVLLNKQQIWGGGACVHCYQFSHACVGFYVQTFLNPAL